MHTPRDYWKPTSVYFDPAPRSTIGGLLPPRHLEDLERAVFNIRSNDYVRRTLAEVVDGVPLNDHNPKYGGTHSKGFYVDVHPSPEAFQRVDTFVAEFSPRALELNSETVRSYRDTIPKSRPYNLRLLEMSVLAFHEMVAKLALDSNGGQGINRRPPSPLPENSSHITFEKHAKPTDLFYPGYQHNKSYPNGVGDIVGYWAEWAVFGGVVVFHRGESGLECNDAFIDPPNFLQIFQLSERQILRFIKFATHTRTDARQDSNTLPFPFTVEKHARRVEPTEAMHSGVDVFRERHDRPLVKGSPACSMRKLDDDGFLAGFGSEVLQVEDPQAFMHKYQKEWKAEEEAYRRENERMKGQHEAHCSSVLSQVEAPHKTLRKRNKASRDHKPKEAKRRSKRIAASLS